MHILFSPFGFAGRGKAHRFWNLDKPVASLSTCHLDLWLGWQILLNLVKTKMVTHSWNPKKRFVCSVGVIPMNKCPLYAPFRVCWKGNPLFFSLGVIPIDKLTFLLPSRGDFGGNPPPQTRKQRILGMSGEVPSVHGVKRFGVVYIKKALGAWPNTALKLQNGACDFLTMMS